MHRAPLGGQSDLPPIEIAAVADASVGWQLPMYRRDALSTDGGLPGNADYSGL